MKEKKTNQNGWKIASFMINWIITGFHMRSSKIHTGDIWITWEYAALVTHKIENETDSIANVFLGVLTLLSHMYNYNSTKFANKPNFLDREYSLI